MDEQSKRSLKFLMSVASHMMEKGIQEKHKCTKEKWGISSIHIKYILALDEEECTLKELSGHLNLDKANTTRAIAYLTDAGFVGDDRSTENSRKYKVFLTDKGKELAKYLNDDIDMMIEKSIAGIPEEQVDQFLNTFFKMCLNFDDTGEMKKALDPIYKDHLIES